MILFPGTVLYIRIDQIKCIINSPNKLSAHAIAVGPFLALILFRSNFHYNRFACQIVQSYNHIWRAGIATIWDEYRCAFQRTSRTAIADSDQFAVQR